MGKINEKLTQIERKEKLRAVRGYLWAISISAFALLFGGSFLGAGSPKTYTSAYNWFSLQGDTVFMLCAAGVGALTGLLAIFLHFAIARKDNLAGIFSHNALR